MMLELFLAFLGILFVVLIISLIRHIFGFVFKLALILLIAVIVLAALVSVDLYESGLLRDSITIVYSDGSEVVGGYNVTKDGTQVLHEEETERFEGLYRKGNMEKEKFETLIVWVEGDFNEKKVEEIESDMDQAFREKGFKGIYSLYEQVSSEDAEDVELYPRTFSIYILNSLSN
jgi:hypothetical protein